MPRAYPEGFANRIYELHEKWGQKDRRTLRQKVEINTSLSDRELFEALPLKDTWSDAQVTDLFFYLLGHHGLVIPNSWHSTIMNFKEELEAFDFQPHTELDSHLIVIRSVLSTFLAFM